MASPLYCSRVVHIPGEIEDRVTIDKLTELNGYLLYFSLDVWKEIRGAYTQSIQRELDQTPPQLLAQKLELFVQAHKAKFEQYQAGGLEE